MDLVKRVETFGDSVADLDKKEVAILKGFMLGFQTGKGENVWPEIVKLLNKGQS